MDELDDDDGVGDEVGDGDSDGVDDALDDTGKCSKFKKCSAPVCPRDEESMKKSVWYPDEDICNAQGNGRGTVFHKLLRMQRRIKKVAVDRDLCFTVQMLLKRRLVKKGVKGVNPDLPIQSTLG